MRFANLEASANASVLNHLANVQVLIQGVLVPGIFRNPATNVALGMGAADSSPTVTVASGAVMTKPVDQLIEIAGVQYSIGDAAPDGTGLTKLIVERVQ